MTPIPKVPFEGKLEQHSFSSLLRAIFEERREGCLTVSRGAVTRMLYFRVGMIVSAASTDPQDRLGEVLVAQGKLSRSDQEKFWQQSRIEGRRFGQTLVVNGRITPTDLYQGVTAQVVTILDRVHKLRRGEYRFEPGKEPEPGTVLLRIPLALYLRVDAGKGERTKAADGPERTGERTEAPHVPAEEPRPEPFGVPQEVAPPPDPSPAEQTVGDRGPSEEEQVITIDEEGQAETPVTEDLVLERQLLEVNERIGEVEFHIQELRSRLGKEPATLLGVPVGASRAVAQQAYHRLAKVLHPDRLPPELPAELAREAGEVFVEVTAAFQVLSGERLGMDILKPERLHPAFAEEDQAKRFFLTGREFISKRNYWAAADALRQAVRLRPREAVYRQYLGTALMLTKRLHEAEEHLVEATRIDPANSSNYIYLGRMYRNGRLYRKAREAFERALRLDPKNVTAREELKDLPEESAPARKSGGSFFQKFFGKG